MASIKLCKGEVPPEEMERQASCESGRAYWRKTAELRAMLGRVLKAMEDHSRIQANEPGNWITVADLEGLEECLAKALAHMDALSPEEKKRYNL